MDDTKKVEFLGEIPISTHNSTIFNKTFMVEQWIRRILWTVVQVHSGGEWNTVMPEIKGDYKKFLAKQLECKEKYITEDIEDNYFWYTYFKDIVHYLENDDIAELIKEFTNQTGKDIASSLDLVRRIRNIMAHSRTVTNSMKCEFEGSIKVIEEAIESFKDNTIYQGYRDGFDILFRNKKIASNEQYSVIQKEPFYTFDSSKYTEAFYKIQKGFWLLFNQDGAMQSSINISRNIIKITNLPYRFGDRKYINLERLHKLYGPYKNNIIGIFISKEGSEYSILLPIKGENNYKVFLEVIKVFFIEQDKIWCDLEYSLQESEFVCKPMFWFYDNGYIREIEKKFDEIRAEEIEYEENIKRMEAADLELEKELMLEYLQELKGTDYES